MHSKNHGFGALLFQFHNGHAGLPLAVAAETERLYLLIAAERLLHGGAQRARALAARDSRLVVVCLFL